MRAERLCILGGAGFVGRHICTRLADSPVELRVLTRRRERNRELTVVPNLELVEASVHDPKALATHLAGCDTVINLIGILNESAKGDFQRVHVELPRQLLEACRAAGVRRLLHMSALGAGDGAPSAYQRSKAEGERLVLDANSRDLAVTAFRPSVIFGPGDSFFSRFDKLLRQAPFFFPLPTPQARFRPVYVGDVAEAFVRTLTRRESFGRAYELCGPDTYSLRELVEYTAEVSGRHRTILGLSDGLSKLQGRVLGRLPGKPYSYDNYLSATVDNVCREDGLAELGLEPTPLEAVVPTYLSDVAVRQRYDVFRKSARRV